MQCKCQSIYKCLTIYNFGSLLESYNFLNINESTVELWLTFACLAACNTTEACGYLEAIISTVELCHIWVSTGSGRNWVLRRNNIVSQLHRCALWMCSDTEFWWYLCHISCWFVFLFSAMNARFLGTVMCCMYFQRIIDRFFLQSHWSLDLNLCWKK